MGTALKRKDNKDQAACSLIRDRLKLVEDDSGLHKRLIDVLLQTSSKYLKIVNDKKGEITGKNMLAFVEDDISKHFLDKKSQIDQVVHLTWYLYYMITDKYNTTSQMTLHMIYCMINNYLF